MSWRYNAGYLQGVSGVQLKGTHTQEFMSGYINGTEIYWYNRGYTEGNNKLPISSTNVNYTQGYKAVTEDNFSGPGKIPAHNQKDFYLGIKAGGDSADNDLNNEGKHYDLACPAGHTKEYCAGWDFGNKWEYDARNGM
jgi:hypothetical protein